MNGGWSSSCVLVVYVARRLDWPSGPIGLNVIVGDEGGGGDGKPLTSGCCYR